MPHVVLRGKSVIKDIFQALKPLMIRDEHGILRTTEAYLDSKKKAILIESLSIQGNTTINFLAMISTREDGVVIGLYPKQEVAKTDGVKRLLAKLALQLLETFPDLQLDETNLNEYLT